MQKTIQLKSGITLGYNEFGSGDRYLLSCQQSHNSQIAYTIDLAEKHGFHVFQIQIRGYGAAASEAVNDLGGKWYDVWAQDACDFADAMGIGKFFYGGISHGSGIGWHICRLHPERLRGFFAGVPGPHSKDGQDTGAARMETITASGSPETWYAFAKAKSERLAKPLKRLAEMGTESPEKIQAAIDEMQEFWLSMPPEVARLDPKKPFADCATEEKLIEELKKIKVPVLIIGGMLDPISTIDNMVRSCKAVENSEMLVFADGTHNVLLEHRREVVDHIMAFCRGRSLL